MSTQSEERATTHMPVEHHVSQVQTQTKSLFGQLYDVMLHILPIFGHGLFNMADMMFHAVTRSFSSPSAAHALLLLPYIGHVLLRLGHVLL